jgi:HK97 family phage prohead protease
MAETYRVPQGVQDEAKKALGWIADGHAGSGFTPVGRKRASDLAAGHAVSADTILRMYSFFKRHEADKQATGFNSGEDGFPSAGRVAWSAWGGDAGFTWSTRIRNQISKSARALSLMASEEGDMADMNQVPDLNEELTELLADVVSFYFRAHGAHWNVKGSDFSEYHKLFNEIYEDVYGSIDPIAENLRKLGSLAPFTLPSLIALRSIEDAPAIMQDPMALASDLLEANDIVIDELSDAFDCATMYGQQGVANFLADRLDKHQFWKWQLTASLGQEVTQPSPDPLDDQGIDEDDVEEVTTETANPTGEQVNDMLAEQGLEPMPIREADNTDIEARKAAIATADRITMTAEVRAVDTTDGSLRLAGYAATFNKEADGLNFREVIAPGAFTRALDAQDPVFLLVNHDMEGIPLASTQSGTLQLRQDANGLYIEAELDPANPRAQELTSALRRGDMDKMSFAFTVQPDGQTRDAGLRTITEIDRLFEVSVVTLPAYSSTSVGMRSQADTDLDIAKRKLKIKVKQHSLRNRKG